MKYKVKIQEILEREINIEAEDEDSALDTAEEMYYDEAVVLDAEDHNGTIASIGSKSRLLR